MSPHTQPQAYLTARELADRLRVRPNTVLRWARDGTIPVLRIKPKTLRFDAETVARAIARGKGGTR